MRRKRNVFVSLLLVLMLALGLGGSALAADSSVIFENEAEKFVFLPGSDYTDTDLFDGFKGVMPGDTVTETITVKNTFNRYAVRIYMKAIAHDDTANPINGSVGETEDLASMTDFLSQLSMTVKKADGTVIYQASPDELDGLRNYVLLGTFKRGESTTLTVELTVPAELGNEYADRVGEVDWLFRAEEVLKSGPSTGDETSVWPWVCLIGVGGALLAVLFATRRKRKAE